MNLAVPTGPQFLKKLASRSTHYRQHRARDVAGARRCSEEDIGGGEFLRLCGAPHGAGFVESRTRLAGWPEGFSGVQTEPGATAFTRVPRDTMLWANALVNAWMPPFVIE